MKILKLLISIIAIAIIGIVVLILILNLRNKEFKKNNVVKPSNKIVINEYTDIKVSEQNKEVNNTVDEYEYTQDEYAPELTYSTAIEELTSNSELYSLSQNISRYYNYIKDNNVIENSIKFTVKKAFVSSNQYQSKYYIQGNLIQFTGNSIVSEQEKYIVMYLDLDNNTYRIEESTIYEFQNMKELMDEEDINIEDVNYNRYEYTYINGVRQLEVYLEDYYFYLANDIYRAYNLLDEEYREKRFKNVNEFQEFILNNQSRLQSIKITQFNIIDEDGNIIYIGTDEDGNYYKVIVKSYMDYRIMLDNYTIINEYNELDDDEKIKINVDRFISMLNSKDYRNAYNLLEQNFKETYFKTNQDFINYVQENFFERNIVTSKELEEEGICIVNIRETISTRSNKMEKTFKVNLLDEEFNIEFEI